MSQLKVMTRFFFIVLYILTGCTSFSPAARTEPAALSEVIVTQDAGTLPSGCRPAAVADFVMRFLAAYNEGQPEALEPLFGDDFQVFSITDHRPDNVARTFIAYDADSGPQFPEVASPQQVVGNPASLVPHLIERRAADEQWRLLRLSVNYSRPNIEGSGEEIGFSFLLAASHPSGDEEEYLIAGRGEANCPAQTIESWSMIVKTPLDGDALRDPTVPCPEPEKDVAETLVIACGPTK